MEWVFQPKKFGAGLNSFKKSIFVVVFNRLHLFWDGIFVAWTYLFQPDKIRNQIWMGRQKMMSLAVPVLAAAVLEHDMKKVVEAMLKMYESWNILVHLPEELPVKTGYELTIGLLDKKKPVMGHGFFGVDFCTWNPDECAFKEYCPCLKYWDAS